MAVMALTFAFTHPESIVRVLLYLPSYALTYTTRQDETTPLHELFLAAEGIVFAMVIGSFACYHIYLIS